MNDLVIIGGGPGGYHAAIRAAQLGLKATIVEKDVLGGVCLNRGCIPTKTLLSDTGLVGKVNRSNLFDLKGRIPVRFDRLINRKNRVIKRLVKGIEYLVEKHKVEVIYGRGALVDEGIVEVTRNADSAIKLATGNIMIATGSIPFSVPGIEIDGRMVLSSDHILDLRELPASLAIIGGGYIGMEFATIFSNLGTKVHVLEMLPGILASVEPEISTLIGNALRRKGVKIHTETRIQGISEAKGLKTITFETRKGVDEIDVEKILCAVGRTPLIDDWMVDAGLETARGKGISVNAGLETNIPGVYAVGDVKGGILLAHVASTEGVRVVENLVGPRKEMDYRLVPFCIFTQPEIAFIGLTEGEARKQHDVKVGGFEFRANSKAVAEDQTEGFVKIITDEKTGSILGVHIVGPDADALLSAAAVCMKLGAGAGDLAEIMQAHPTTAEALTEAALDVKGMAINLPPKS